MKIYSQKSASIQPRRNLYFLAQIDKRSKSLLRFKLRVRSEKCIFGRPRPRSRRLGAEHSQPNSIREHWISVSAESETWLGLPVATGRCRPRSTDPAARPRARGSRGRQPGVAARRAGCPGSLDDAFTKPKVGGAASFRQPNYLPFLPTILTIHLFQHSIFWCRKGALRRVDVEYRDHS